MSIKGKAFERKESYECFTKEDKALIDFLKKSSVASEEKEYDNLDHSKCYLERKKIRCVSNHICGGAKDPVTGERHKKCLHCRFFFSFPTFKDVTKE